MRTEHPTDVEFIMADPVPRGEMSLEDYHDLLSSKSRTISVTYRNRALFDITIPAPVFNPATARSTKSLTDIILKEEFPVAGSRFVDLGCGSGVIGLAAAEKRSKSVLYTDINPNIQFLKSHPNFRPGIDRVEVQSFCDREPEASADIVVFSIPSGISDHTPDIRSIKAAFTRDHTFITTMVKKISRILVPGGRFVFWYGIHPGQVHFFSEFIILLGKYFNGGSLKCLLEYQFEDGYTSTVYSIKKIS